METKAITRAVRKSEGVNMKKETIRELRELINKAYEMGNDSKISLWKRMEELL